MDGELVASQIELTGHARQRAAQRNLSLEELRYVIRYGRRFHKAGVLIYFLRACDLPSADRADDERQRLVGTAVVLSPDGQYVLTAWRNRQNGLQQIKRKVEYSVRQGALRWAG